MTKRSQEKSVSWRGRLEILPGVGVFHGRSGDNREHRHWAHQLSIGLDGDVEIQKGTKLISAEALFIRADAPHRLNPGEMLSLYIDPTTVLAGSLVEAMGKNSEIATLPLELTRVIRRCFAGGADLGAGVHQLQQVLGTPQSSRQNERSVVVLKKLQTILTQGVNVDRDELAELAGLSPSRFSHWFKEETGMPLRGTK